MSLFISVVEKIVEAKFPWRCAEDESGRFLKHKRDLLFLPFPEKFLKPIVDSYALPSKANDPHIIQFNLLEAKIHLKTHDNFIPNFKFSLVKFDFFILLLHFTVLNSAFANDLDIFKTELYFLIKSTGLHTHLRKFFFTYNGLQL